MKMESLTKPKVKVYKPPQPYVEKRPTSGWTIFLAGSIEMGKAEDWQTKVENMLRDEKFILFNPRRDDWDNSWKQTIEDENFHGQVKWEHDHLRRADVVLFYFDPTTKSPISLMELGLVAKGSFVVVVCPDGFWRKGNVEFICKEYKIPLFTKLEDAIDLIRKETKD